MTCDIVYMCSIFIIFKVRVVYIEKVAFEYMKNIQDPEYRCYIMIKDCYLVYSQNT